MARRFFDPATGELVEDVNGKLKPFLAEDQAPEDVVGPTKQNPFRFASEQLSGQSAGITGGVDPRVLMPRSPALTRQQGGGLGKLIGGLPTLLKTVGEGEGSFQARVYDIQAIGKLMGLSKEEIDKAINLTAPQSQPVDGYNSPQGRGGFGPAVIDRDASAESASQGFVSPESSFANNVDINASGAASDSSSPQFQGLAGTESALFLRNNLNDEQQLLRGISRMVPQEYSNAFVDQGRSNSGRKKAGEDLQTIIGLGVGDIYDPTSMTQDEIDALMKKQRRATRRGRRKEGDDLLGNIIRSIVLGGVGAIFSAGILGPLTGLAGAAGGLVGEAGSLASSAASGLVTGVGAGATSGALQGLASGATGLDLLKNIGLQAGLGGLGGGIAGGVSSLFGGPQAAAIGRISAGNLRGVTGAVDTLGGLGTFAGITTGSGVSSTDGLGEALGYNPDAGFIENAGNILQSKPVGVAAKAISQGLGSTSAAARARNLANAAVGAQSSQIGGQLALAQKKERQRLNSIFLDNPYYEGDIDGAGVQAGVLS